MPEEVFLGAMLIHSTEAWHTENIKTVTTVHGRYQSSILTADSRTHTPVDDKLTNVAILAVSCSLHDAPKPGSDDTGYQTTTEELADDARRKVQRVFGCS